MRSFASDNNAGVHPLILQALSDANSGHAIGYGDDPWTNAATDAFRREFGPDIQVFFVFLGTAANVLALNALTRPHQCVICAQSAHINVDECGAPERFLGSKLLTFPAINGKLSPHDAAGALHTLGEQHHSQPKTVSITQATELGTLYTPDEVRALADFAHANNMYLHMDGARIANAAAALSLSLSAATRDLGVDVLSFGGTKNGMMYGEAVLFFQPALAEEFRYIRKQGMQLASKMRYISAQFSAMLTGNLWRANAAHANAMAQLLSNTVSTIPGVTITRPTQTNAVFARIPARALAPLQREFFFYVWDPTPNPEVRWMTAFDTTPDDINAFALALRDALA